MNQGLIANLMAERVVQLLEIVEIDEHQRKLASLATRARQLLPIGVFETAAIERAGQGVGQCHRARFAQGALKFVDPRLGGQQLPEHAGRCGVSPRS